MLMILLTPDQVSVILGLSVKRLHELVRQRKIGCVQVSARDRMFSEEQIEQFIQSRMIEPPKPIDTASPKNISFRPKPLRKGVDGSQGVSRAELLAEVRSWQ